MGFCLDWNVWREFVVWENPDLGVLTPSPPIEGTEMPPLKLPYIRFDIIKLIVVFLLALLKIVV
jgi:hypothetical protein